MASETSMKGSVVEAEAICYYTKSGYVVSIPFTPTDYDLLIEKDGIIHRIQCKKACLNTRRQTIVGFRRMTNTGKKITVDFSKFDYLYSIDDDGTRYIVPSSELTCSIPVLTKKYIQPDIIQETKKIIDINEIRCGRCGRVLPKDFEYKCCDRCREKAAASNRKRRIERREQQ